MSAAAALYGKHVAGEVKKIEELATRRFFLLRAGERWLREKFLPSSVARRQRERAEEAAEAAAAFRHALITPSPSPGKGKGMGKGEGKVHRFFTELSVLHRMPGVVGSEEQTNALRSACLGGAPPPQNVSYAEALSAGSNNSSSNGAAAPSPPVPPSSDATTTTTTAAAAAAAAAAAEGAQGSSAIAAAAAAAAEAAVAQEMGVTAAGNGAGEHNGVDGDLWNGGVDRRQLYLANIPPEFGAGDVKAMLTRVALLLRGNGSSEKSAKYDCVRLLLSDPMRGSSNSNSNYTTVARAIFKTADEAADVKAALQRAADANVQALHSGGRDRRRSRGRSSSFAGVGVASISSINETDRPYVEAATIHRSAPQAYPRDAAAAAAAAMRSGGGGDRGGGQRMSCPRSSFVLGPRSVKLSKLRRPRKVSRELTTPARMSLDLRRAQALAYALDAKAGIGE